MSWLVLWMHIRVIPQEWGHRKRYRTDDEFCLGHAPSYMSLEPLRGPVGRAGRVAPGGSTWMGGGVGVSTRHVETKALGTDVEREVE